MNDNGRSDEWGEEDLREGLRRFGDTVYDKLVQVILIQFLVEIRLQVCLMVPVCSKLLKLSSLPGISSSIYRNHLTFHSLTALYLSRKRKSRKNQICLIIKINFT